MHQRVLAVTFMFPVNLLERRRRFLIYKFVDILREVFKAARPPPAITIR